MNRRLAGDVSLNLQMRDDGDSDEWQDWVADESSDQEARLADSEEWESRRKALGKALSVLTERERRIFEARRLAEESATLQSGKVSAREHKRSLSPDIVSSRCCRMRSSTATPGLRWQSG